MGDIFISYKAEDRERVRPLVAALEADGLGVWWDVHIEGGSAWRQAIQERLDGARCVLVAWSRLSVGPAGHFVQDEATRAQRRGICLPVRIDPVEPPIGFGEIQALDLIGWKGDARDPRYRAVLTTVRAVLSGERRPAAVAAPARTGVDRRLLLAGGGGAIAAVAAAGGGWWWSRRPALATNAIAVLPFQNLSGDPAQAWFADGLSEELRDALARLAGLQVAARISSDTFRDARDAATIAARLGVGYVLDGSVRRSGDLIRVSAQLIDGQSGFDRWSQSYDRRSGDALTIQSDIAGNVVRALSARLGAGAVAALQLGGTRDPAAHDQYLKGLATLDHAGGEADFQTARAAFEAALAIDPRYAAAHAGAARATAGIANSFATAQAAAPLYRAALASARQSIALAPGLAQAHYVMGYVLAGTLHIAEATPSYEQARRTGGGDAEILTGYAGFVARLGRAGDAAAAIGQALRLDPLNPRVQSVKGATLLAARDYGGAIAAYRAAMALNPRGAFLHWSIGDCHYLKGELEDAAREYALETIDWARATGQAMIAWKQGDKAAAAAALAVLSRDGGAGYQIAEVLAQRGDAAGALDALEAAWAARDGGLGSLRTDPMFDPLRGEARFRALLGKVGFA